MHQNVQLPLGPFTYYKYLEQSMIEIFSPVCMYIMPWHFTTLTPEELLFFDAIDLAFLAHSCFPDILSDLLDKTGLEMLPHLLHVFIFLLKYG